MIKRDPATGFPIYKPDGEVLWSFMTDTTSRVKIIQGPQGSGTSSALCLHAFQQALAQAKQEDGRQRFRVHVFRETYPMLESTFIKTWLDWFKPGTGPGQFGTFYETRPYLHEIRVGPLEMDVTFAAMDDIADAKAFFDSLETSLIIFNEVQHAQFKVVAHAASRVSPPRYPANKDGGCSWGGLIADTNAPPADHWIPIMRGDVPAPDWMTDEQRRALIKPDNWRFFLQPAGLLEDFNDKGELLGYRPNPAAENLHNLHPDGADPLDPKQNFYMQKLGAQTKQWIDAYIMNRSAVVTDGKPVYPQFRRDVHVSDKPLRPITGVPVTVGLDFGRQPAATIGQQLRGDWFVQKEFIGRDVSATEFAPSLKGFLTQYYPGHTFIFWGDPAGAQRGQSTDKTPFEVFQNHGMVVRPAPNPQNRLTVRHEAMNAVLMQRSIAGRPSRLLIDPACSTLITGMGGGYFFRRKRISGEQYDEEPFKNQYSHVCEALENLLLGGGEGKAVTMGSVPAGPTKLYKRNRDMRRISA